MCLVLFSYGHNEEYNLILAANRDEFYDRPAQPAKEWGKPEGIVAGKDLRAGGTWLGVDEVGRYGVLTNFRDPAMEKRGSLSRGKLVLDYLQGAQPPERYLNFVERQAGRFNGFNILVGDKESLWYYSNVQGRACCVKPGVYGLSNHLLNTPWPKVERGKLLFKEIIRDQPLDIEALFDMMKDKTPAADERLPDTGIPLEWERALSSMFIRTDGYGTRCSTVLTIKHSGEIAFYERTYPVNGDPPETVHITM